MASLFKDLVRAGIPTDHHESDLYVLDTPEARETIKKYGYKFTTFTSDVDGKRWIDVPFAYAPFWEKKRSHATKQTASGSDSRGPRILSISRGKTFAGQRSITAKVQYPDEKPSYIEFVGPSARIGGSGPVVMIYGEGRNQMRVTDPSRFGEFGPGWVRRFFESA